MTGSDIEKMCTGISDKKSFSFTKIGLNENRNHEFDCLFLFL